MSSALQAVEVGFPQDAVDVLVGEQVDGVRLHRGTEGTAGAETTVGPHNVYSRTATAAPGGVLRTTYPTALATRRLQSNMFSGEKYTRSVTVYMSRTLQ